MATNYASIITFCLISTFFLQDKGPITTAGVLLRHPSVIFMSPADNIKGQKSETASTQHQSDQEEKGHAKVREEDRLWTFARRRHKTRLSPLSSRILLFGPKLCH